MNIEFIPADWIEIDETEFRVLLDSMNWRRDAYANGENYYRDTRISGRPGEQFAVRIRERIWVKP